jgi:hypothetical protein
MRLQLKEPAIVCVLGLRVNWCYVDGEDLQMQVLFVSYIIVDEASGNYLKKLIADYLDSKMSKGMALEFEKEFNLDANQLKKNSNQRVNSKMYIASFAKFMFDFKDEKYIKKIIKKVFQDFFKCRALPCKITREI